MSSNSISSCGDYYRVVLSILVIASAGVIQCYAYNEVRLYNSFTISSFNYPEASLRMSEWRYIRVELPPWFSSMSVAVESDVSLSINKIERVPKGMLPVICFRDGSLPLPDVTNTSMEVLGSLSNISVGGSLENAEHCYPVQKNMSLKLTNEQISPGVYYFGIFNGIGSTRTQSKMINRGPTYSFSTNISVEGCPTSTLWGPYCNQTVEPLSCLPSVPYSYNLTETRNGTVIEAVSCTNFGQTSCHGAGKPKVYSLEVSAISERLTITAKNVRFGIVLSNNTRNSAAVSLVCFARFGAMPSVALHDYNASIDKTSLVIQSPKVGRWFIAILPLDLSGSVGEIQNASRNVCYSLGLDLVECPLGKAGPNCSWERYQLQTILRTAVPFQSYYLPVSEKISSNAANFPLEPLLSNSSHEQDNPWTYFLLDIPRGAAGGNIHIKLTSDSKINYEIYARNSGLPSLDDWDYYYANKSRSSEHSIFFKLYNSTEGKIDFYILYVKEGIWSFGVRQLNSRSSSSKAPTTMSISLERCPNKCSSHGQCKNALDASGLTSFSFCDCDRTHGGFDCSIEIVSRRDLNGAGHVVQSIFLVASNAAAILPAYWALRKKAFPEWILFTSSGIASGLYHACDVGMWCILSYNVLQFMDFWLSFMAVVSTFVYLTTICELYKRTIHAAVAILTALMAITKATRSSNIILVMAIGVTGLLIGWLVEISTKWRQYSFSLGLSLNLNILEGWVAVKGMLLSIYKKLRRQFRWVFMFAGFIFLAMAATSWVLETSASYWLWHSLWHVTIYTSSFFFLCSKGKKEDENDHRPMGGNYELTRQDSFPRGGQSYTM